MLFRSVFGDKWNEAIPIVEVLCFAGAIQSISQWGGVIFSSIGKPEINTYFGLLRTGLTAAAIVVGSFYGILTVAWLLLTSKVISYLILLAVIRSQINFHFVHLLSYLKGPIFTIFVLSAIQLILLNAELYQDALKIISMILTTMLMTGIFHWNTIKEMFRMFKLKGG